MIEIKNLAVRVGNFSLRDINLTVDDGEYFIILGPTGAGKTVLVECLAGLHHIRHGEIRVDGVDITRLAPEERSIGYVPQDYVLFPFLNVADNIAFGLRSGRGARAKVHERVVTLAEMLGIANLMNRDTRSLSGGEKQRVALARALAPAPPILILDEPLSSLDMQTAKYLRLELQRMHRELGVTMLHVTHDQVEAEELADRIAILNMGGVEQVGRPQEVFFYPANEAVSDFIGALNILDCDHCRPLGDGLMEVDCRGLKIVLFHDGDLIRRIALFPRDIYLSTTPPPGPQVNRFQGIVTGIKHAGVMVRLEVEVGANRLLAEMPYDIFEDMGLVMGGEVYLILKLRRLRVFEG